MSDSPLKQNRVVKLSQLIPHARNYKQHPQAQIDHLVLSLQRFGQGRSIVVQDGPEKLLIVAGHGIVEAATALQWQEIRADILPADWTPEQITGYLVADNLHAQQSSDDDAALADLLQEQVNAGYDLAGLGTDEETLRQMLASLGDSYLASDDSPDTGDDTPVVRVTLADRFIIPPFSVLDARQGYWQERKRAWLALGIQSELGRGENALQLSVESSTDNLNHYRNQNGSAGLTWGDKVSDNGLNHYRNKEKANNNNGLLGEAEQARSHYSMGGTPAPDGRGGLSDQLANKTKNGKESTLGAIPPNERDRMSRSGKYSTPKVGKAQEVTTAPDGTLLIDRYRQEAGERKPVRDKQGLIKNLVNIHAYDEGSVGGTVSQSGTSIFDPVLCELAYRWFSPPDGMVLDPFAGGSVRGIVAAKCGRRYTGIDLRAEQIAANEQQAQAILSHHAGIIIDASDPTLDHTPELTPVMEHGGYRVKRDDLFQMAGVRGGKVRTVWALAQEATGLVTSGSRHSPHVHRVAAIAQRLGIPCHVHVASGENTPDVQGAEDAGAEIIRHKAGYLNVLNARAREDAQETGYTLIPFGVVCDEAVKQVSFQVANLPTDMTRLVVPVGSGITLSGILQGLQRYGYTVPVLGVCVGKDPVDVIDKYAPKGWRDYVTLVQSPLKFEEHPKVTHLGDIPLDPTYEAKCLPYLQSGDVLWSVGLRASEATQEQAIAAPMPTWVVGDSRNIASLCAELQSDLIFTCPPYYDLEVYSDNPDDLSVLGTYAQFITDYRTILQQAIATLKPNRFVCIVVGDIRDKKGFYRNFVSDTITACQDAGARLYNEAILVTSVGSLPIRVGKQFTSGRKLGKTHQNVLVFCKGDPKKAVADCGPVIVDVPEDEPVQGGSHA